MFSAIDFVPLTAIPFFMLTGELMTSATITDRLVNLSQQLIGRMRGSMAQANVLVSMFFAGMNGSVVADAATVGSLTIPAMKRAGYPSAFSAGITAVSSTIGGIIPPSIMMIVLANASEISVGALFAGGIIPGIMVGALLMLINHFIAVKNNFERSEEPFSLRRIGDAGVKASFALLIPVVLVGAVVGGVASVVEAGALTAVIALVVGLFVYRTITWANCRGAFMRAFRNSATVFIIIAAAGPFSWLLTSLGAIQELEEWLLGYTHNPLLFALVLCIFIYLLGMVMDSAANIIVVGPVIVEVMVQGRLPGRAGGARVRRRIPHRLGDPAARRRLLHRRGDRQGAARERRGRDAALHRRAVLHAVPAGGGARHHDVAAGPSRLHGIGGHPWHRSSGFSSRWTSGVRKFLAAFCVFMLAMMVVFTVYTIIMRYVFHNPPMWGDLLTSLSNIWFVFIALSLTVREKEQIALNLIYSRLPVAYGFALQQLWTGIILLLGLVIAVYGMEAVSRMGGKYWEMWYFAWEDGWFVFKPNYMPKKYAMTILPLSGTLISLAALVAIIEDVVHFRRGTFVVAGGGAVD